MEEQKFQFVEEQVKPNKKRLAKEWFKKVLKLILSGLVFGVVAGLVILFITGKIPFGNKEKKTVSPIASVKPEKKVSTPSPQPKATPEKKDPEEKEIANITIHKKLELGIRTLLQK